MKAKATTDVELGSISKDSLDDTKLESSVYANPLTGVAGTVYKKSTSKNKD